MYAHASDSQGLSLVVAGDMQLSCRIPRGIHAGQRASVATVKRLSGAASSCQMTAQIWTSMSSPTPPSRIGDFHFKLLKEGARRPAGMHSVCSGPTGPGQPSDQFQGQSAHESATLHHDQPPPFPSLPSAPRVDDIVECYPGSGSFYHFSAVEKQFPTDMPILAPSDHEIPQLYSIHANWQITNGGDIWTSKVLCRQTAYVASLPLNKDRVYILVASVQSHLLRLTANIYE